MKLTEDLIRNSLSAKWAKFNLKAGCYISIIIIATWFLVCLMSRLFVRHILMSFTILIYMMIAYALVYLPMFIYYILQYKNLFKNIEDYQIYEVKLDTPRNSYVAKAAMYYLIKFKTINNQTVTISTKPSFHREWWHVVV